MKSLTKVLLLTTIFLFSLTSIVKANGEPNPTLTKITNQKTEISDQFGQTDEIEQLIISEGLSYDQLMEKYPDLSHQTVLKPSFNEEEFFRGGGDSPLGIPGFIWGFCLGVIGMIIVYVSMDEGSERKSQVRGALYGCIIGSILSYLIYLLAYAPTEAVSEAIMSMC